MSDQAKIALLEIEPAITDAKGAAAVIDVLNEQLFTKMPANGIWRLSDTEVDALRHAIFSATAAIERIDEVHREVLEKFEAAERPAFEQA